jgi:AsmA protein
MARAGKRIALVITIVVVLALVVPPFINVGRYKARIVDSMSRALGRPGTFGSMSLRLLPQPGFDFDNLAIGDDPRFGAEPIIRADSVTANLRLASLWRGRLEIARLDLNYPSLNIVRSAKGEWNIESLLYQASRTPTAPTSSMKPERQLR